MIKSGVKVRIGCAQNVGSGEISPDVYGPYSVLAPDGGRLPARVVGRCGEAVKPRVDLAIDTRRTHRRPYFGRPARCGATVLLKLLPLLASQFVDQSIAPRSDGYLATGM